MTLIFNEGKACDAVIRVLETRQDCARQNVRLPEHERHSAPIELACHIGNRLFALEHTGIEPFAGHMQMEAEANWLFRPIEAMVAGKLPPNDTFELTLPVNALRDLKKKELGRVQSKLADWIIADAPNTAAAPYGRYLRTIKPVQPPGVPFAVRLDRFQSIVPPGRFMIKHSVTQADLESLRQARIQAACEKKFPKLDAWRQDAHARTVLVLEDNDIQLTNPAHVFDTLETIERSRSDRPDEIYLVSTIIENPWYVHALRVDDQNYYELSEAGQCLTEFNPSSLVDLTDR